MEGHKRSEVLRAHSPRVLIVEDDEDTRTIYADFLSHHGCKVRAARSGKEAAELAHDCSPDLALVDIMLPDISGRQVAARLSEWHPGVTVIFVTAVDRVDVAVEEMHRGAFYYLTKPVGLRPLLEVVEKACSAGQQSSQVRIGALTVDLRDEEAYLEDEMIALTPTETKLLMFLVRRRGRTTTYQELWREVWGFSGSPDRPLIRRTVSNLRAKVGEEKIETVWGRGYRVTEDRR
ncbi:MAG: response regulator transcription factor [Anaerolineae bacterium]|jgi:DNA-binding response OmpR family regulator